MSNAADVLVIGGGINGVSVTYHLARRGVSVLLLEKSFIAGGPTGHSSAIIRQHYSNRVTASMALESLKVWQNFADLVGGECGFTRTGFVMGVHPEDVEGLKANVALQKSVGIETRFVSPEDIQEIEPQADVFGLGGAAYEPEAGYCDAASAANGFSQAATRLGAQIQTGVQVTGLRIEPGRVIGVDTPGGFIQGDRVVVACGPWSAGLLHPLGLQLPLVVARVKIGLFQRPVGFDRHCIWGDFPNQVYLRPETGGLTLVGSISPEEADDRVANPDSFSEKVDLETLSEFAERAVRRFPVMASGYLHSSYAALYDITPDWHPVLDAAPGIEGLYVCAGGSGHGFKLAPAVGRMMAHLILEGKQSQDDIQLFSWERFSTGNLVRGQYAYSIVG